MKKTLTRAFLALIILASTSNLVATFNPSTPWCVANGLFLSKHDCKKALNYEQKHGKNKGAKCVKCGNKGCIVGALANGCWKIS